MASGSWMVEIPANSRPSARLFPADSPTSMEGRVCPRSRIPNGRYRGFLAQEEAGSRRRAGGEGDRRDGQQAGQPLDRARRAPDPRGRADPDPAAQRGAVPGRDLADHHRPLLVRGRGAGSRAQRAARSASSCSATRRPTTSARRTSTASAPPARWCATRRSRAARNHLMVQGERRFRVLEFLEGWPFLVASVAWIPEATRRRRPDDRGALPAAEGAGRRGDPPAAERARRARRGGAGDRVAGPARRHGREPARHQERGKAGPPRDLRPRRAPGQGARASSPSASRCCACRRRSATRRARSSTSASASTCCASRCARSRRSWATTRTPRPRPRS